MYLENQGVKEEGKIIKETFIFISFLRFGYY